MRSRPGVRERGHRSTRPDDARLDVPVPSGTHRLAPLERRRLDDREHPLLALARHHLDRAHGRLPTVDRGHVDVHPEPGPTGGLARRAAKTGTAEILYADDETVVQELETGFDETLLLERITHLNVRSLVEAIAVAVLRSNPADACELLTPLDAVSVPWPTQATPQGCRHRTHDRVRVAQQGARRD